MRQHRVISLLGWCLLLVTAVWCQNRPDILWLAGGHAVGLTVLFQFGESGELLPADMNQDGVVDDSDLLTVLFNLGNGCGV